MIPVYPGLSLAAVAVVVVLELVWLRTGVFRLKSYWIAMAIIFAFQIPVDGWMTKLSDPIVIYNPDALSGLRFPWDIPTEEFAYAFAMITLSILLWERSGQRRPAEAPLPEAAPAESKSLGTLDS